MKVTQQCPTLCDPVDSTVHGILQARVLEWVAFPFSRASSQPRDWTQVFRTAGGFFTSWATREPQREQSNCRTEQQLQNSWVCAHTHTPCSHCFFFRSSHSGAGSAWGKPFPKQCTSGQCWFVSYVPRLTCSRKSREISAEFSFLIFEHILRCSQNCFLPDPPAIGGKELAKSDVPSPNTVRISTLTPQGLGQQAPLQSLYITMSTVVFSFWTWR